ncbi:MAG: YHYH domain-containing protein [Gammaproteobacteria bacterium]|nr:MAG: YHYH domain-containing protein [Gammaproteobacteria bacterium]
MQKYTILVALGALCLLGTSGAWAHGGGLDSYGCHHNRKAGGYHCHRGPLAGQHFDSKAEMLRQLNATDGSTRKNVAPKKK